MTPPGVIYLPNIHSVSKKAPLLAPSGKACVGQRPRHRRRCPDSATDTGRAHSFLFRFRCKPSYMKPPRRACTAPARAWYMKEGSVGIGSGYPLTLALPSCTIPTFDSACNSGTVNCKGSQNRPNGPVYGFWATDADPCTTDRISVPRIEGQADMTSSDPATKGDDRIFERALLFTPPPIP